MMCHILSPPQRKDYVNKSTYKIAGLRPSHFQFLVYLANYIFKTHYKSIRCYLKHARIIQMVI